MAPSKIIPELVIKIIYPAWFVFGMNLISGTTFYYELAFVPCTKNECANLIACGFAQRFSHTVFKPF